MLPERQRFDAWCENFALKLARVDVTTPDVAKFRSAIRTQPLDRLSVVKVDTCPVGLLRTRELVRDGDDDVSLAICSHGSFERRFGGKATKVVSGSATLVAHHLVGEVVTDVETTSLSVRISRTLLRDILGPVDLPISRPIPTGGPALSLLTIYMREIAAAEHGLSASMAALADRQICELVAHLLDPTADIVRSERFGGVKAARLKAIVAGIERHLADPALSAEWLGAKLGLSERYVHHLLADTGTTFSQLVRRRRLDAARRMLEDHSTPSRRIVDIAYAVGFGDLSNFNRAFRQHFGRTPSDVRRGS